MLQTALINIRADRPALMQVALLIVLLCLQLPLTATAAGNGWNCVQNPTTGEWDCRTRTTEPAEPDTAGEEPAAGGKPLETTESTQSAEPGPAPTPTRTVRQPAATPEKYGVDGDSERVQSAPVPTSPGAIPPRESGTVPETVRSPGPTQPSIPQEPAATPRYEQPARTSEPVADSVQSAESTRPASTKATIHTGPGAPARARPTSPPAPVYTAPADGQTPSVARQPGWSCAADAEATGWNCNLVGPDPAGKPHPVAGSEPGTVGSPTFSNTEEMVFNDMMSRISYDPWGKCTSRLGPAAQKIPRELRKQSPIDATADYSDIYDREIITFSGNVDVTRADQRVLADRATYNTESRTLNARGNVHYIDQDFSLYSDSAYLDLDDDQGRLRNSQFVYGMIPARGRARVADMESKSVSRYWDAAYTTCAPRNQDWTLEAGTLELDRNEGVGTATNAWLELSGVPVLYTPYLEFPIDNRRKDGVLVPSFGVKRDTGFDLTIPYYFNLAPNYDFTLAPRIMTERGFLLGGNFRYLTESTEGHVAGELIPYDYESKTTRGAISVLNATRFTRNLTADLDLNYVSDNRYLDQIGNAISFTNFSHIRSQANLRYNAPGWNGILRLENFQTIDPTIPSALRPYRRLPQLLVNGRERIGSTDGLLSFRGEYVHFQRKSVVNGNRIQLRPDLSWPVETAGAFVIPRVAVDYSQYFLTQEAAGTPSSISRVLPVVSLDGGLTFEREFSVADSDLIQTLEPRLYYLYIPDTNQNDIPLFDTSEFDFTLLQLFRENRFNSIDRIGDANQISVALTSRILEPGSGRQLLDGTLGTIVYFADRNVQLSPAIPAETDRTSSIVGELNGQITDEWSFRSGIQWNPHQGAINRGLASLHYQDDQNRILNLAYRYRLNRQGITEIEQADGSIRWPLFWGLAGVGRWQYSILDNKTLESFVGIEKESCCWRFRILGRYWIQTTRGRIIDNGQANTGIFAQVEFKGFTSFGDNVDQFLERNIAGYEAPE